MRRCAEDECIAKRGQWIWNDEAVLEVDRTIEELTEALAECEAKP